MWSGEEELKGNKKFEGLMLAGLAQFQKKHEGSEKTKKGEQ